MMLGEISPGGVGSGLYGMLVLAVLAVFIAGLMVGRTPEYLGKKIGRREITLVALYILVMPAALLIGAGLAMSFEAPRASDPQPGAARPRARCCTPSPRRPTTTAAPSPGSSVNTAFYNTTLGLCMLLGRFLPIVFVLALAGSLARQQAVPRGAGTLPTHTPAVRRPARRRRAHRRRPDLLPRPRAGPDRGRPAMSTTVTEPASRPDGTDSTDPASPRRVAGGLFDPAQLVRSLPEALRKLDPRHLVRAPVMFVVEVGSRLHHVLAVADPSVFASRSPAGCG